ncbi:MAG: FAD:protein FMN transferase [Spirochaetota bacterium]
MHNKETRITKNKFIRSLAALTLIILATVSGCSRPPARQSETELLLGTTISVTTYGRTPDGLFESVFARVREVEERMSTSEDDYTTTELMAVNDAAGEAAVTVSPDTFDVVRQAVEYSRRTGGAFDVTVGPLVSLWGIGSGGEQVPAESLIEETLESVDYRRVRLDPAQQTIYLPDPDMAVDVGGIAKGYAADEAARVLREQGVSSALLDFGGNILTVGEKPDGSPWRIGIQVPDAGRGEYLGIAEVVDLAVVTSGTYERYFSHDGVRYHHILDTETGYPARNGIESVTIITPESMRADALSTALFVMGAERGMAYAESQPDVEAMFVNAENEVFMSSGMGGYFSLTNEAFTISELSN